MSIGEFSARCGLSPKMLRTYAADGLLTPAAVDQVSGYRYYAPGQVHDAKTIGLLRRAGVPLVHIATFLCAPRPGRLDQWERELDNETRIRLQALAEVREHLALDARAPRTPTQYAPQRGGRRMPTLTAGSATDIGLVRASNQDALLIDDALFAVADGMGGAGEAASTLALNTLQATFARKGGPDGLLDACRAANSAVWHEAQSGAPDLADMGSTITAIGVVTRAGDEGLAAVNVGDSRAYLLHLGQLRRLTVDHSHVQEMVLAGDITEQEARLHPQRSLLTRALGIGPTVLPDVVDIPYESGDRLLLCTDGLFTEVDEHQIGDVLTAFRDPGQAATELVGLATAHGGHDNVSVVIIDIN